MILDTSIVIDFLLQKEPVNTELTALLVEADREACVIIHQRAELCDVAVRNGRNPADALTDLDGFTRQEEVTRADLIEAAHLKWVVRLAGRKRFSLADAVMLAVGRRLGETVVTKDGDFAGLEGVTVLGHPAES